MKVLKWRDLAVLAGLLLAASLRADQSDPWNWEPDVAPDVPYWPRLDDNSNIVTNRQDNPADRFILMGCTVWDDVHGSYRVMSFEGPNGPAPTFTSRRSCSAMKLRPRPPLPSLRTVSMRCGNGARPTRYSCTMATGTFARATHGTLIAAISQATQTWGTATGLQQLPVRPSM